MRLYTVAFLGGVLIMGATDVAAGRDLAMAGTAPKSEFVVFTEKGSRALSASAIGTIRSALDKARGARQVTLTGRPQNVAAVKNELVRQGVSANAIIARNDIGAPLPKAGDGLSDPADRRVEITF